MTGKWMPGTPFPDATPPVRTMQAKFSDGGIVLIVHIVEPIDGEQHVLLPAGEARHLAVDLAERADHIDPPARDEHAETAARCDLQRHVLRQAAGDLGEPPAGRLDDLILDAARRLVAAANGGQG